MFAKLLRLLIHHPKSTFCTTFFLCSLLSSLAFKLDVDASAQSLLLEDDRDLKIFRDFSKKYRNEDFVLLAFKAGDAQPFSQRNLSTLRSLHEQLEQLPFVHRILSIINAPLFESSQNTDFRELLKNIPNIQGRDINLTKAQEEILNSPFYKKNIISKDGKTTAMIIYLNFNEKYDELIEKRNLSRSKGEKKQIDQAIREHRKNVKQGLDEMKNIMAQYHKDGDELYISGVSIIVDDMITYIRSDLKKYGISLLFLLALALYYFFRSWYFVFLALFICFINLSTTSGIFSLLNFHITVISSNYLALVLIISLSIIVHLITHFIKKSKQYPRARIENLILQTLLAKAKPSFYAIITSMIGFLSLIFSKIEPLIKLGIMMNIGIALALILSYLFFLSILMLVKMKKLQIRDVKLHFLLLCAQASFDPKKRLIIYAISSISIILALIGIFQLRVENSFVNYFKDSSQIKKALVEIDQNLGGTLPLDLIISFTRKKMQDPLDSFESEFEQLANTHTYWFDSKKTRIAKKIHEFLENKEFIGSVLSLNSFLMLGKNINNGRDLDDFTLAFLNENLPTKVKQDLLSAFVNIEDNELRFSLRIIDSHPKLRRNEFLIQLEQELQTLLENDGVEIQMTGIMILYNNMLQSLFSSQLHTLFFVLLSIFILFSLIFKNVRLAMIALLVNIIPLGMVFAVMGILDIALDMMSITIAAIALGIGVDDTIHYIYRFKEEMQHKDIKEAIFNSHLSIGSALYYTSISIILGFGVMMSSNFIPTIYFGFLTVFVMILLSCATLFLLPSFLMSIYSKNQSSKPI